MTVTVKYMGCDRAVLVSEDGDLFAVKPGNLRVYVPTPSTVVDGVTTYYPDWENARLVTTRPISVDFETVTGVSYTARVDVAVLEAVRKFYASLVDNEREAFRVDPAIHNPLTLAPVP